MLAASYRSRIGLTGQLCCAFLILILSRVSADDPQDRKSKEVSAVAWKPHVVRRLGDAGGDVQVPAKIQIVHESENGGEQLWRLADGMGTSILRSTLTTSLFYIQRSQGQFR